jgi:hypothetical protein
VVSPHKLLFISFARIYSLNFEGEIHPHLTPAHHGSPDNRTLGPERGELDAIFGILACT